MARPTELTDALFIKSGIDIQKNDSQLSDLNTLVNLTKDELRGRWNTGEGKTILAQWRGSRYDRTTLQELVGSYYGQTDLRGIPLSTAELKGADLSNIDFFSSDFYNADLSNADLTNSWLSESNIQGAKFNWAKMDSVLIDNVDFNLDTSFLGVNLARVNFTLATLLKQQALDQERINSLKKNSQDCRCS